MRQQRTGLHLSLLTIAAAEWSLAGVFEAAGTSIYLKTLWSQISYLGIVFTPVFYLLFALAYSNRENFITPRNVIALSLLPLVTILVAFTNDAHHLLWTQVGIHESDNIGLYSHGVWFYVNMIYSYLLVMVGIGSILTSQKHASHLYVDQQRIIILGAIIPLIANLAYVFGMNPIPGLDWTPISFGASGMLFAIGIFQLGMLNLVPIARDFLVENMDDGMMALDLEDTVIDVNPAMASRLGKRDAEIIGKNIETVFSNQEQILTLLTTNEECETTLQLEGADKEQILLQIKVASIVWAGSRLYGRLLTCREIASS